MIVPIKPTVTAIQRFKPTFSESIKKFSNLIKGPENLKKKLDFIGLIEDKSNVLKLQDSLLPGQVLVSLEGEIWRWDGYVSKGKQNSSTKAVLEQLKKNMITNNKNNLILDDL